VSGRLTRLLNACKILAYRKSEDDKWRFLSNFYRAPFSYNGEIWLTSEHFYQAMKFSDDVREHVRCIPQPSQAKRWAREHKHLVMPDWEKRQIPTMKLAVLLKFSQTERLLQRLLATGEEILIEENPYDWWWGSGDDGQGENVMGQLLMEVRSHLRFLQEGLLQHHQEERRTPHDV
jgi:ribA/ribD-fused uncharacterized protein